MLYLSLKVYNPLNNGVGSYTVASYIHLHRAAKTKILISPQSTQRFNKVLTPLLSLQSPHK